MILFVNGSPHRDGRTARMAADLLAGLDYETLNLIDYRIEPLYSDHADGDRFEQVRARVVTADVIVLGTPVYWHSLGALPRTLFERMYGAPSAGLAGRKLAFFTQGDQPRTEPGMGATTYTITRFAVLYGLDLIGTAFGAGDLPALRKAIDVAA